MFLLKLEINFIIFHFVLNLQDVEKQHLFMLLRALLSPIALPGLVVKAVYNRVRVIILINLELPHKPVIGNGEVALIILDMDLSFLENLWTLVKEEGT